MKTVKKTLTLFIDMQPLANSEVDPVAMVNLVEAVYFPFDGYNRFKVRVEIDCPLADEETDLGTVAGIPLPDGEEGKSDE